MKEWLKISCLLCVFGFLRELRPSEPFITEYLLGEWRNITQDQVNREVYPIGTYSYLAQLVLVFLITDFLRYKPLIITIGVTGIIIWSLLIWTTSLLALQILEVFYGTYMAAEVAYYTYIYAKVDKKYYPRVTSHTRAAMYIGRFVCGVLSQLLVYFELMDYKELNYITLATQILCTIWAFGLPKVDRSLYFHQKIVYAPSSKSLDNSSTEAFHNNNDQDQPTEKVSPTKLLWSHFCNAYTNVKVVQWSIWYAVGFSGFLQVYTYVQVLWADISPDSDMIWNGAVEAAITLVSAVTALLAGYLHAGRFKPTISLIVLSVLSVLEGGALLMGCKTDSVYVSYAGYIVFGGLFAFTITVASAEVARYLEEDSFGLVFGINTLVALILQTLLTLIVVSESGFALSARGQYTVYSYYFIGIGCVYFLSVLVQYFLKKHRKGRDL